MNDSGRNQYQIIRTALYEQIDSGALPAGTKLPSERQLSGRFGTTRVTLREALSALEADGLVYREDRRGWFISPERLVYDPTINSNFHQMVLEQGRKPATQLINATLIPVNAKVQKLMKLAPLAPVYRLQRLRQIDDRTVLYTENYINPDYVPELLDKDLAGSLTTIYSDHYDIYYQRVSFSLYPVGLHDEPATLLKVSPGSSGLMVTRINYDQHDRIVDCDFEYWRQDSVVIEAETRS